MESRLNFDISRQPDYFTCGPTALQGVYRFFGDDISVTQLISEIERTENGGTLAVFLGTHALRRGYDATLYTWNLNVFDPTWFLKGAEPLASLLLEQKKHKPKARIQQATRGYLDFLELGGRIKMEDLTAHLIRRHLKKDVPILAGLSSTYLYNEPREFGEQCLPDNIRGTPQGHFVVLCGYDSAERNVMIADPLHPNPLAKEHQQYTVDLDRVMCAIMLGIVTYDSAMLVVQPRKDQSATD